MQIVPYHQGIALLTPQDGKRIEECTWIFPVALSLQSGLPYLKLQLILEPSFFNNRILGAVIASLYQSRRNDAVDVVPMSPRLDDRSNATTGKAFVQSRRGQTCFLWVPRYLARWTLP